MNIAGNYPITQQYFCILGDFGVLVKPNWFNKEVEKAGINVSKTLQETLMDRLNVSR